MKEIAGNLKRDMKDLLGESASIVAGFFKQGLCTVRGMTNRWKNFTQDISDAVGALFQPFENALPPAPSPEREPMVTVMESDAPELPVGTRMTLHEAETRIEQCNSERWDSDGGPLPVKVAIDYIMEGEQDRYWLPLNIGAGCRPMLEQMEDYVTACFHHPDAATRDFYNAPEDLGALLHERFGPQLQSDLEKLSTRVLGFFRQHCTISRMEEQFEAQAEAMPEKERDKFKRSMAETITALRLAANTGQQTAAPKREQERPAPQPEQEHPAPARQTERPPVAGTQRPRRSVKLRLRQIKGEQTAEPAPPEISQEIYRYYSTQRPIDIGTFPKPSGNQPTEIQNFDVRTPVEDGAFMAWGILTYAKPLTADELARFELRPSLLNLDVYQAMAEQAAVVGPWERKCKIPAEKRLTQWNGATDTYTPAKGVMPEQLAERCRQAKEFPDGPIRRTGAVRPRPHRDR